MSRLSSVAGVKQSSVLIETASGAGGDSLVAPVEGVELGVAVPVLELERGAGGDFPGDGVADRGLLELEAVGQDDPGAVLLAGDRVLDRLGMALANARDAEGGAPLLAVERQLDRRDGRLADVGADRGEDLEDR